MINVPGDGAQSPAALTPTNISYTELAEARQHANRVRGEWITALAEGVVTVADVIRGASADDGAPLRALSLKRVLKTQRGWGSTRSRRLIDELRNTVSTPQNVPDSEITIGWLIDRRTGARRLVAFANLLRAKGTPWAGFPHVARPER